MTQTETDNAETAPEDETYAGMLREYLGGATWIGPSELPLVFHLRKLCRQLDNDGLDKAALASAYLQAFARLDKRRPGAPAPVPGDLPGQGSIFDELED